jgi:hypothetical protein
MQYPYFNAEHAAAKGSKATPCAPAGVGFGLRVVLNSLHVLVNRFVLPMQYVLRRFEVVR